MTTETFDLMLLDVTLPGRDGLQILSSLRDRGVRTPVLVLSARDSIRDRALGLNGGADDYIVKPFALEELMARIRTLGKCAPIESMRFDVSDLSVDLLSREVTRGGVPVKLTVRELQLLEYLLRNEGHVVSRETLAREVWREPARTGLLYHIIDVYIGRLRRKIDVDGPNKLIHAIRGVGFMIAATRPDQADRLRTKRAYRATGYGLQAVGYGVIRLRAAGYRLAGYLGRLAARDERAAPGRRHRRA